jgi:DNA helicase II / ATP-dependent DNA helicase PcrA
MPPPPAASFPGPDALGRGVVVAPGAAAPPAFDGVRRVVIDDEVLRHPQAVAALLHDHWLQRRRIVIELTADNEAARTPEVIELPPYALSPDSGLYRERLHALTWANTYDLRRGEPIWWHGELAARHTAATRTDQLGDIVLPDGSTAWVDGGPRGPVDLPSAHAARLVHRESIGLRRLTVLGDVTPGDAGDLAPDQLAAVAHPAGPARVIAPAGSGKTRVLTSRLRHLLADRGIERELVTAVAYNTRAAAEMRARTHDLDASIRTLHSLALWICNLDRRRDVIQERDVRGLLDRLVRTARIPNQDPFQPYLEALSEVRLALRDPSEVEALRGDVDGFAEMFPAFREELDRRDVLDFDEQIYRAIELMLTRPDIRRKVQRAGTHLLVDEFQDLTPAFLLLIRLVADPMAQVFAVGDDDQTIYSYAGATPAYLVEVDRWFPGARPHALEINYRCPPAVVDRVVRLLSHNRTRVAKTVRSGAASVADRAPPAGDAALRTDDGALRTDDGALSVRTVPAADMASTAVERLRQLIADGDPPTDLAVLARVNSALLPVQVALTEAGVAHTAPLDTSVLGRTGVRSALAYLRLGLDLDRIRREDLLDTLNRPARKVRSAVTPLLPSGRLSLRRLEQIADALDGAHRERFAGYLDDLRALEQAVTEGADTAVCLRLIRDRIGLGEAMDALDRSRTRPEGSSHADDLDALLQLAALQPDPAGFRDWLSDRLRAPADPTGITLSTVHRVKGMEWEHVVVFAANAGLFPHRLADDVEEERRVLHVAVTRCRRSVTLVADRERPSPFLPELEQASERPLRPPGADPASRIEPVAATRSDDGHVAATPGTLIMLVGGLSALVIDRDTTGVKLQPFNGASSTPSTGIDHPPERGPALWLPYGATVLVDGQPSILARRLAAPGTSTAGNGQLIDLTDDPVDEHLFEALRGWRARIAADSKVPAYLVFHDRHLRVIAGRKPRSLSELAGCPGVGPTKLERYGDDVLDIVESHA